MSDWINIPKNVHILLNSLRAAGYEAYIVGGCVRDCLMGLKPKDWDITTSAKPDQVKAIFRKTYDTGIAHGTVSVRLGDDVYEVTTYRVDGKYSDFRRPDAVSFTTSLREDLKRRDFTINAMAYDPKMGLIDYFQGKEDLSQRRIRCVGDAKERFQEDALRMLRARRFSAQLGFQIEAGTARAIQKKANLCRALSKERVCAETEKTLLSERPETLGVMIEEGLLAACALEGSYDLRQLRTVPPEPDARWAMLQVLIPELDLHAFRMPAKRVRLAEAAAAGYQPHYDRQALKELMAEAGTETAFVCAQLSAQAALFREIQESGECVSLRNLAVSGKDFPALAGKRTGEMLQTLLRHVLLHPEDNNRQTLLRLAEEKLRDFRF